jgi:transcriptional regulator NrdR family protein
MSHKPPIVFTCVACGHTTSRVVDARGMWEADAAKRVRECLGCHTRFTTTERIDEEISGALLIDAYEKTGPLT